jgi:hypothetical protein
MSNTGILLIKALLHQTGITTRRRSGFLFLPILVMTKLLRIRKNALK